MLQEAQIDLITQGFNFTNELVSRIYAPSGVTRQPMCTVFSYPVSVNIEPTPSCISMYKLCLENAFIYCRTNDFPGLDVYQFKGSL